MKLKVCGLTILNQVNELACMKTDFLGFIFYEKSPRYVLNHLHLHAISKINHNAKVGVFVNENLKTILETAEKANLNFIQLHGDESENYISELKKKLTAEIRIIKVLRIGSEESVKRLCETINSIRNNIDYLLFDTDSKAFGGTGKQFNWSVLNEFEIPLPYFLSGGISDENINNIEILNQKPFALDINSKFEIEAGNKDVEKIKKFKELFL